MKLLWILFSILLDLAFKLAMIVAAFYLIVAIGMGLYWLFFDSGAGLLLLLGVTVLVIVMMVAGAAASDSEKQ